MLFDFKFDWDPKMATGVDYLDAQHKEYFRIARDIEQLILTNCIGVTTEHLLAIVCDLKEYVSYHFYDEESLMDKVSYPYLEKHQKIHQDMIRYVSVINCPAMKQNPLTELKKLKEYLQNFLFQHMLIDDHKMVSDVGKERLNEIAREMMNPSTKLH